MGTGGDEPADAHSTCGPTTRQVYTSTVRSDGIESHRLCLNQLLWTMDDVADRDRAAEVHSDISRELLSAMRTIAPGRSWPARRQGKAPEAEAAGEAAEAAANTAAARRRICGEEAAIGEHRLAAHAPHSLVARISRRTRTCGGRAGRCRGGQALLARRCDAGVRLLGARGAARCVVRPGDVGCQIGETLLLARLVVEPEPRGYPGTGRSSCELHLFSGTTRCLCRSSCGLHGSRRMAAWKRSPLWERGREEWIPAKPCADGIEETRLLIGGC